MPKTGAPAPMGEMGMTKLASDAESAAGAVESG